MITKKKIYTHIGNTHLKHTNKMASLDLRKMRKKKKKHLTIKPKPLEGGVQLFVFFFSHIMLHHC